MSAHQQTVTIFRALAIFVPISPCLDHLTKPTRHPVTLSKLFTPQRKKTVSTILYSEIPFPISLLKRVFLITKGTIKADTFEIDHILRRTRKLEVRRQNNREKRHSLKEFSRVMWRLLFKSSAYCSVNMWGKKHPRLRK